MVGGLENEICSVCISPSQNFQVQNEAQVIYLFNKEI